MQSGSPLLPYPAQGETNGPAPGGILLTTEQRFVSRSSYLGPTRAYLRVGGDMSAERSKTEQLKALHRRVIEELWNNGNLDVIDEHVHPELRGRRQAEGMN